MAKNVSAKQSSKAQRARRNMKNNFSMLATDCRATGTFLRSSMIQQKRDMKGVFSGPLMEARDVKVTITSHKATLVCTDGDS